MLGRGGDGSVYSAVNEFGEVVVVKLLDQPIREGLRKALDFHVRSSSPEYTNSHIGKMFGFDLRLAEKYIV